MTYFTKYDNEELFFNNETELFKAVAHQINEAHMNNTFGKSDALLELCARAMAYYDRGVIGSRSGIPRFENIKELFDYLDRNCKTNGKIKYIYYPFIREDILNLLKENKLEDLFVLIDKNSHIAQSIAPNYNQDGYYIFVPNPYSSQKNDYCWGEVNNTKITGWIPINGLRNINEIKIHIKE